MKNFKLIQLVPVLLAVAMLVPTQVMGQRKKKKKEEEEEKYNFTKIHEVGLLSIEMALTPAQEVTLKDQVIVGDDVTITLDLNGTNRTMIVNYSDTAASSSREVVRTTILTMDVKEWT